MSRIPLIFVYFKLFVNRNFLQFSGETVSSLWKLYPLPFLTKERPRIARQIQISNYSFTCPPLFLGRFHKSFFSFNFNSKRITSEYSKCQDFEYVKTTTLSFNTLLFNCYKFSSCHTFLLKYATFYSFKLN